MGSLKSLTPLGVDQTLTPALAASPQLTSLRMKTICYLTHRFFPPFSAELCHVRCGFDCMSATGCDAQSCDAAFSCPKVVQSNGANMLTILAVPCHHCQLCMGVKAKLVSFATMHCRI